MKALVGPFRDAPRVPLLLYVVEAVAMKGLVSQPRNPNQEQGMKRTTPLSIALLREPNINSELLKYS